MKYLFTSCAALITWLPVKTAEAQLVLCDGSQDSPCDFCALGEMVNVGINWFFGFMIVVAVLVVVSAGFKLVTSGGDVAAKEWAKARFTWVVIGFLLMLASWLIVDTILKGLTGSERGMNYWGSFDVENCGGQVTPEAQDLVEYEPEIENASIAPLVLPTSGGFCPGGYTFDAFGSCVARIGPVLPDALGNCPRGYTRITAGGCAFEPSSGPTGLAVNANMNPIFDPADGGSSMVRAGAAARMQAMLNGPFACLQRGFGRAVTINDAIAKAGSSRETNTRNSRHFFGDALDLSTRDMSNADKLRLFQIAKQCGFSGFGFGSTILHVDLGPRRGWSYNNSTYGGQSVQSLINSI